MSERDDCPGTALLSRLEIQAYSCAPLVWCGGQNICPYSTVLRFIAFMGKTKLDEGLWRGSGEFAWCLLGWFEVCSRHCGPWFPLVLVNMVNFSSSNLTTTQLGLMREGRCGVTFSPTLGIFQLFILAILAGILYPILILTSISLVINDVQHLFTCLLAIWRNSFTTFLLTQKSIRVE